MFLKLLADDGSYVIGAVFSNLDKVLKFILPGSVMEEETKSNTLLVAKPKENG